MSLIRFFSCDPNSGNISAIQAGDIWGKNILQNRLKAAVAKEEQAKEGAAAAERPQGGWRTRRDRGTSGPEQESLVRDFLVFYLNPQTFPPYFLPLFSSILLRTGSEMLCGSLTLSRGQPSLVLLTFRCDVSLRVQQEKGNKTIPSLGWHLLWMLF